MSFTRTEYYVVPSTTRMGPYMLCARGYRSAIKHPRSQAEAEVISYGDQETLERILRRLNDDQDKPHWAK